MKNLTITTEKIESLIKESANFLKVNLTEIIITDGEFNGNEKTFDIHLCDDDSNLVSDVIFIDNVISDNDLDDKVTAIVEKLA